jgi:hypothetical protein
MTATERIKEIPSYCCVIVRRAMLFEVPSHKVIKEPITKCLMVTSLQNIFQTPQSKQESAFHRMRVTRRSDLSVAAAGAIHESPLRAHTNSQHHQPQNPHSIALGSPRRWQLFIANC